MKNPDSHIWLYAKNWYKKSNVIMDMKTILAHRSGCEPQHIREEDIIIVLTHIVYPYLNEQKLIELAKRTFIPFNYREMKSVYFFQNYIESLLSILNFVQVKEISTCTGKEKILIELDEPDYTLLPKPDKNDNSVVEVEIKEEKQNENIK